MCSILFDMRAGALPSITPARPETGARPAIGGALGVTDNELPGDDETRPVHLVDVPDRDKGRAENRAEDRAAKVARLELVRPGITTAATMAHERTLPVAAGLRELVPRGALQRGTTIAAHGVGATSLSLALVAEAVRQGSFLAVVAPRSFGLGACLDFEIPLRRVVQFVLPEREQGQGAGWAQLVAAVIEGFDAVIVADRRRITGSQARQLSARVRERGTVLVRAGGPPWPDAADLRYDLAAPVWQGLGAGHGHLASRVLRVQVAGRRWHGSERVRHVALPASTESDSPAAVVAAPPLPRVAASARTLRTPVAPDTQTPDVRHAGSDIEHLVAAEDRSGESVAEQATSRATA